VVFWFLYDAVCRVFSDRENGDTLVGALVAVLVVIASWLACHLFAGRAAFLLVGAMIATAMSANVLFWIIPGQRKMVAAIQAGQPVDPVHGKRGKQRSVHNTYFTLPVLFAMLSNHYSFTWSHPHNWVVLVMMMFAGAAIRQFFVLRHGWKLGRNRHPLPYAGVGVAVILGVMAWLVPAAPKASSAPAPSFAQVQTVMAQRCLSCHGAQVQMKNVRLDSPEAITQHAQAIYQQVVVTRLMPMNNATGITEDERAAVGAWFNAGAKGP
jgi:uncharacterized membrane protein